MPQLAPYALPGIIVASALGAVIMCLLVFRYGFAAAEEDPGEAAHRLFVTRFWHALAGVCFAVAAMLATVAWSARSPAPAPPAPVADDGAAERVARLDDEVRRLEERLNRELAALEERLGVIEVAPSEPRAAEGGGATSGSRAAGAVGESPSPPSAAAPKVARKPAASPPPARTRPAPAHENGPATLPADAGSPQMRTTLHGVNVDVRSRRGPGREILYVVRLSDTAGRPLTGADVSLVGQAADGAPFQAVLRSLAEAGVYQGRAALDPATLTDLRLRVVRRDKRFELSLAQGVSW